MMRYHRLRSHRASGSVAGHSEQPVRSTALNRLTGRRDAVPDSGDDWGGFKDQIQFIPQPPRIRFPQFHVTRGQMQDQLLGNGGGSVNLFQGCWRRIFFRGAGVCFPPIPSVVFGTVRAKVSRRQNTSADSRSRLRSAELRRRRWHLKPLINPSLMESFVAFLQFASVAAGAHVAAFRHWRRRGLLVFVRPPILAALMLAAVVWSQVAEPAMHGVHGVAMDRMMLLLRPGMFHSAVRTRVRADVPRG